MKRPLFLAPPSYRQSRVRDALRMLPALAGFLIILPMLWGEGDSDLRRTGTDAIYLFAVWLFLVIAAAILARYLAGGDPGPKPPETPTERGEG